MMAYRGPRSRSYSILQVFCGLLVVSSAQEVEDGLTTTLIDTAFVERLRSEASSQCSYRYSNNIYSVTEAQCRECVNGWSAASDAFLSEDREKTIHRITYDCRPMKSSREYLRKLCRSSSLPERQTLDSYVNCDSCLAENGVKENGTTFDEFVNARKACVRTGHRAMVLTSFFGGRMRQTLKYNYDYELLREKTRAEACTEHFDEQIVAKCQKCLDDLFLWPDAPFEKVSTRIKSCLPPLTIKEILAKTCHLLEDPTLKDIFQSRDMKTCHTCFNESQIDDKSSLEEKLAVSFSCLPPADPTRELHAQLCGKIERNSMIFKDSETDQPRDLCYSLVTAKNLSVGLSYADYKAALQDVSNQLQHYISTACNAGYAEQEIEKCKACVELALSRVTSIPGQIRRWDFIRSFRCVLASRNPRLKDSQEPLTTSVPDDIDVGSLPDGNGSDQTQEKSGFPKRIASDF